MVLPCGRIDPSGIAHVLIAQKTLRVARLLRKLCGSDSLGVLLGLREVYSNVKVSVLGSSYPAHILLYAVTADIVGVLGELVEIVRCLFGAFLIAGRKLTLHLGRSRCEQSHELCVKKVTVNARVLADAFLHSIVKKLAKHRFKVNILILRLRLLILVQTQGLKQAVGAVYSVGLGYKPGIHSVGDKLFYTFIYHNDDTPFDKPLFNIII